LLKVAGIQLSCKKDKDANLNKALELLDIAVDRGAKIAAFPELFNLHWFPSAKDESNFAFADDENGDTINTLKRIAARNKMVIICPVFEKGDNGDYYNTAFVIDSDGAILGKYRKAHIPMIPHWEEKFYFKGGDTGFTVFKTAYCNIGIQICWDNFFPEGTRILALKGAEIIFSPTAAAYASSVRWAKVISANAIANNVYIFRINRVGKEEHQHFYGKSFCVDPNGEFIAGPAGSRDSVIIADINLDEIKEARKVWPFFKDRRPDTYSSLLE